MPQAIPLLLLQLATDIASAAEAAGVGVALANTVAIAATEAIAAATVVGGAVTLVELLKTPTPEGQRTTIRQAIPPRRRGFGVARLGGAYLLDYANAKNDLFRIVAFCDGPVNNISRVYLAQDCVLLNPTNGVVQKLLNGAYPNSVAAVHFAFGVTGVNAFPAFGGSATVWNANAYGTGIFMGATSYFGSSTANFPTDYPRGPAALNVVGQVNVAFDWRDMTQSQTDPTTWKNTANPLVALVHELWNFRGYSWALDFEPALAVLTAEANVCDVQIAYLNVFAQILVFSAAGATHVILRLDDPVPAVGVTIFVGSQSFVVTSTETVTIDGVTGTQVDWTGTGLLAAIGIQQQVRWQTSAGSPLTEPTYAGGGAWNADETEADTVKKFLDCMDGWMMRRGSDGAMIIRSGHYYAPTVTIGPDELISYTWEPYIQAGKVITEVVPAFVGKAWDYTQIDTDPWDDDTAIGTYGLSSQAFKPDFVQSNGQVRRLAKARLSRLLAHTETIKCKISAIRALGERFITLAIGGSETADLENIVVEIVGAPEIVDNGMAITFPIAPMDVNRYTWDAYTDEGNGPATTAPEPSQGLTAPTITDVEPFTQPTVSGSTTMGERLHVFVTPPDLTRTDLTWFLQWQVSGATIWNPVGPFTDLPAGAVELDTGFVPTGAAIVVQARYQTGGGQFSPWSASANSDPTLITTAGVQLGTTSGQDVSQT